MVELYRDQEGHDHPEDDLNLLACHLGCEGKTKSGLA
jgi:hypothetical protein